MEIQISGTDFVQAKIKIPTVLNKESTSLNEDSGCLYKNPTSSIRCRWDLDPLRGPYILLMMIGMVAVMTVPIGGVVIITTMITMITMIIMITMSIVPMVVIPNRPDRHSDDL